MATTNAVPITRAEVMNLIQTRPGHQDSEKGNCHSCGKPGHWANKYPEKRKNVQNRGTPNQSNQTHDKPKSWRTVPPPPGTGSAKKVKTFNWCEKCCRWTTTHTTATHTGLCRNPTNINTTPQANMSTLSPDPLVWMFDFTPPQENNLLLDMAALHYAFLSSRIVLLFFALIILCVVYPTVASVTVQSIQAEPWSTILSWIANVLREFIHHYPTALFAPILWLLLLLLPLVRHLPGWKTYHTTDANPHTHFTHRQRRYFSKLLCHPSNASNAYNAYNATSRRQLCKAHPSYPLRLRHSHPVPVKAPTLTAQDLHRQLNTLHDRALCLQRQLQRLRTVPSMPSPTTVQKGEEPHHRQRERNNSTGKNQPAHPGAIVGFHKNQPPHTSIVLCLSTRASSTSPSTWTTGQRNAAQRITTLANLACATSLRMDLQAPARMRDALGFQANTSPIIWDSGASISISPDPNDFQGTITSKATIL